MLAEAAQIGPSADPHEIRKPDLHDRLKKLKLRPTTAERGQGCRDLAPERLVSRLLLVVSLCHLALPELVWGRIPRNRDLPFRA